MTRAIRITDGQRRFRLAHRHRLIPTHRSTDVTHITDDLVAVHSSDPVTVYVSIAARTDQPTVAKIESALYEKKSIIRHHAMRRTLWVMTPLILQAAHVSTTKKIADRERKRLLSWLAAEPDIENPETWMEDAFRQMIDLLDREGALTTKEIGSALPHLRFPLQVAGGSVNSHSRLALQAGFEGRLARTRPIGSWVASQYRWASAGSWSLPDLVELGADEGSDRLLSAWLRSFGPGTERDIRWWTGWTAGQVRATLARIEAEPVTLDSDEEGWIAPGDTKPLDEPEPWVALLPGLDSTTMGWKDRDWYLGDLAPHLFDRNGNAGPTVWSDGRIVGGWRQQADGEIALNLLQPLDRQCQSLLEDEVDRIKSFLGDARISVRFPPPRF